MTYQVQNSDNSLTFIISDNVVDDGSLSLALIGRNVSNYGQYIARNTIHHLENFASPAAPNNPLVGQLWYNKTPGSEGLQVWDGTDWTEIGAGSGSTGFTGSAGTGSTGFTGSRGLGGFTGSAGADGSGSGTVTNVASGTGLTGGPITSTGTLSIDQTWLSAYIGTTAPSGGGTGDITGVTAGGGLTGGGTTGDVTVTVGAGTGITVNADNVAVDQTWLSAYIGTTAPSGGGTGDITGVTAGNGLTGGGASGDVTVTVGAGTGITVNADDVAVSTTWLNSYLGTAAGKNITANQVVLGGGASGLTSSAGLTYASSILTVSGAINATGDVTAFATSDRRLKENIMPIDHALDKISQINGVMFDWTDTYIQQRGGEDGYFQRRHDTGVIAQEVEQILPEAVATRETGYLAVKYEKLVPLLIQAVKELSARVKELEGRL